VIDGNTKNATFLTVPELADLLHVNEKKIYKLAGEGDIPGTKITGKWIFPRHLIEDWISENSHGGAMTDRLIITGSDDRFIEQICSQTAKDLQQTSFLSYSPCGTRHGLRMLDMRRADACFINWGASDSSSRRHLGLLRSYKNHQSWVVVRCLQRNQGLVLSRSFAQDAADAKSLLENTNLRWAKRDSDAGAELEPVCHTNNYKQQLYPILSGRQLQRLIPATPTSLVVLNVLLTNFNCRLYRWPQCRSIWLCRAALTLER